MRDIINRLNDSMVDVRLNALKELSALVKAGDIVLPEKSNVFVNNHIHTKYSFSPYSPSMAVWMAASSGLATCGIMDHDSISGAREFIEAGKIIGIKTTIGFEIRVSFANTLLNGKKINNPDQDTMVYVAVHGIPHHQINRVCEYLKPYKEARMLRNRLMVDNINRLLYKYNVSLDYDKDVVPLSWYNDGGTITERHILYALSAILISKYGRGEKLICFLEDMQISVSDKIKGYLSDVNNENYLYDLLGLLKGNLVSKFFVPASDECPDVSELVAFADSISAISAYAYLGDVSESVTGDKMAQTFEDSFLDELFSELSNIGFRSVTYMPSRNTSEQIKRVRGLCDKYNFMQISGEDINSPRQSFICQALNNPDFKGLIDATWALIGHEMLATENVKRSIMSKEIESRFPLISDRVNYYKEIGKS